MRRRAPIKIQASVNLGAFLRRKREEAKLSQGAVARFFKYNSSQFVSNWERGRAAPPVSALQALMQLFRASPEEAAFVISEALRTELVQLLAPPGTPPPAPPSDKPPHSTLQPEITE